MLCILSQMAEFSLKLRLVSIWFGAATERPLCYIKRSVNSLAAKPVTKTDHFLGLVTLPRMLLKWHGNLFRLVAFLT